MTRRERITHVARISAIDAIDAGNLEEASKLSFLLAPIDRRLTVQIFNKGFFDYEVAVGRDGRVTYQPGARFSFGINRWNLRPFVGNNEICCDFEENPEIALEWLRQEVARTLWNYFHNRPDRVLEAVAPLEAYRAKIAWKARNEASLAGVYA